MLSGWLLKKDPGPLLDGGCPYSTSSTCLNLGGGSPGSLGFKVTDFHPSILQSKLQSAHIFSLFYASVGITCPTPTSVEHADIQVKSYSINSRERYVCNSGFKRKAGTSSLTQCVFNETAKVAHSPVSAGGCGGGGPRATKLPGKPPPAEWRSCVPGCPS